MSFKNAFKLLLGKFGYVWGILLYVVVMLTVLISLGLTFLKPVYAAFSAAGVWDKLNATVLAFLDGATLSELYALIGDVFSTVKNIFATDAAAFWSSLLFIFIVVTFLYRFIMGLCELPLVSVIEGVMTDNAKYGYLGKYVSFLGKSSLFSLIKMMITVLYDTAMYGLLFLLFRLLNGISLLLVPFGLMLAFVVLMTFRYCMISAWSPYVIVENCKLFSAFGKSVKFAFKHFGALYSTWFITWMIIVAINVLVGIFTFGVGLLITIPICIFFVSLLNMTFFYGRTKRSYYVDGEIYFPESAKEKNDIR